MTDKRTPQHTSSGGQQAKLDYMVGDRVDGQLVQFSRENGGDSQLLFRIATNLDDIRELLITQNAILAEAYETAES